jgi:hypothetical protein
MNKLLCVASLLCCQLAQAAPGEQDAVALARGKGHGWVDYKFRNPETGKVEAKSTYVLRVGDVALEAGIYKH